MAITQIAMDTGILQGDIKSMEEALTVIKTKTENMFTNMTALDGMWDGVANQVFMAQFTKDYNSMKDLCTLLGSLIENIKTAKSEYEKCEASITTVIDEIQIESL